MVTCNGRNRHEMVDITKGLRMCECSAEGWLSHLKGAVAEARRLVDAAGGFDSLRRQATEQRARAQREKEAQHEELLEKWHSAGTYQPVRHGD